MMRASVRIGVTPPESVAFLVLQNAQQARLRTERQIADAVEEERAAVGLLEAPGAAGLGAGKCASLMAKQFGLEQRLGKGGAVELDQRQHSRGSKPRG